MANSTVTHAALDDLKAFVFYRYAPSIGAVVLYAIWFTAAVAYISDVENQGMVFHSFRHRRHLLVHGPRATAP